MSQRAVDVYLGLGTNVGDRLAMLRAAVQLLVELGEVFVYSSVYETEPWGVEQQDRFLNACCGLRTTVAVEDLHARLKQIERRLGRVPGLRWGPRLIDLDLLTYGELAVATPTLTIPHPRIADRAFVLVPLAEIAPRLVLRGQTQTVAHMLAELGDTRDVVWRYAGPEALQPTPAAST